MIISVFEFLKSPIRDLRSGALLGILVCFCPAPVAWSAGLTNAASAELPSSSKLPFKQQTETDAGIVLRTIGGLIAVIAIGYGAVYVMKRYFPSIAGHSVAGQNKINVIEVRRLTPKTTLFWLEIEGTRLLLAQSGDRITRLHATVPPSPQPSFIERHAD